MLISIMFFHYHLCTSLMIKGRQLEKDFVKIRDLWIKGRQGCEFLGSRSYWLFELFVIQVDLGFKIEVRSSLRMQV